MSDDVLDVSGPQPWRLQALSAPSGGVLACGLVGPAYDAAGDAFDLAASELYFDVAVFDGMGHGTHAAALASLAVSSYCHARQAGRPLREQYLAVEQAVRAEYWGQEFVTGVLARLHLHDGALEWARAGHPAPLLMRGTNVIGELGCDTSLPFGLGGGGQVATEQLEPGDALLFFTDGVHEGRSPAGELFGTDRLAQLWEGQSAGRRPPETTLREMAKVLVNFSGGKLHDDATLLLLRYDGPPQASAG